MAETDIFEALSFVRGAVASKNLDPALTHYRIENGIISGYNGRVCNISPIDFEHNICPYGPLLNKALDQCKDVVNIGMTPKGRLSIRSGKFRAFVPCLDRENMHEIPFPKGEMYDCPEGFIDRLQDCTPFMSDDASRPWAHGILITGTFLFAATNICVIQSYVKGLNLPRIVIPSDTVRELLKAGQPERIQTDGATCTFHYGEGKSIVSRTVESDQWPDEKMFKLMDGIERFDEPIPPGYFESMLTIEPFLSDENKYLFIDDQKLCVKDASGMILADVEYPWEGADGKFAFRHIKKLISIAKTFQQRDSGGSPRYFTGDNCRGVIAVAG